MANHLIRPCPSPEELLAFLDESAPEDKQLADHIDHCPTCQEQLDRHCPNESVVRNCRALAQLRASGFRPRADFAAVPPPIAPKLGTQGEYLMRTGPFPDLALPGPSAAHVEGSSACNLAAGAARQRETDPCWPKTEELPLSLASALPPASAVGLGQLGKYQLLKELGSGGMGIVYRARDTVLDRLVAVKVIRPELAGDEAFRRRFLGEARAAAGVKHEHIVTIHEADQKTDVLFLVMEHLEGRTLEARLKAEAPLPVAEVLRIGREIAEALAAAHECNLIHRDVKPSNVWLEGPRGRVKVLDFGLAKNLKANVQATRAGTFVGSLPYVAPEQASDQPLDPRCDLFSLGCVLYQMSVGRLPFQGDSAAAILTALLHITPPAPHQVNPELPPALSGLIMRLLAKSPGERPADAGEVVRAFLAIEKAHGQEAPGPNKIVADPLAGLSGSTCALPAPAAPKRGRRWPWVVAVLLGLGPLVYFCGPTVMRFASDQGELVLEIDDPKVMVRVKQGGVEVEEPTTKRSFVLRAGDGEVEIVDKDGSILTSKEFKLRRGRQTLLHVTWAPARPAVGRKPAAPSLLDKLDPAKIPAAIRFEKMPPEVVGGFGKREKGRWDLQDSITLSADGTTALTCREGKMVVWNVAGGAERSFGPRGGGRAALSADGRRALLSSTEDRGVSSCSLWDVTTGKELQRTGPDFSVIFWLDFDPSDKEGRRALLAHRDYHDGSTTIRLWDVTTGKELKAYQGHKHYSGAGAFSPDGRRFVSSGHGRDQSIRLWDVEKGQKLRHADLGVAGGTSVSGLAFSRDGRFVLVGGATLVKDRPSDGRVWVWDTEQKKPPVQTLIDTNKPVRSVAISPDGKVLAAMRSDARVLLVEFPSGKAIKEIQLERPPEECGAGVAFAPDGRHLLAAHGNGAVYVLRLARSAAPPRGSDKY
jgi:hypothetical protein